MTSTLLREQSAPSQARPIKRPSLATVVLVELRKSVNTRAGRWVLLSVIALAALTQCYGIWQARNGPVVLTEFSDLAQVPISLILPVVGILAMTSEWSQRTALTTFTLLPRRLPVILAKVISALILVSLVMALGALMVIAAVAVGGLISDDPVNWSITAKAIGGILVTNFLNVIMGVGFGALLPVTGVALTTFFVAPTVISFLTATVLKARGEWVDVYGAFARLADFDLANKGWQTAVSLVVWIAIPLGLGLIQSVRREVK
ncbi:MAG: ABC transporter permease [Angustibacter sp.]